MSWAFEAEASQVRAARRLVRAVVHQWGVDPFEAELVASELAANAVLHARSRFTVTVSWDAGILIQVADLDAGLPAPTPLRPDAVSGRGLSMVQALSDAWGVDVHAGGGKTVWARLGGAGRPR